MTTQSGYVAIVGRPNVGKSTLINQILGQKIAITSNKPQTTRHSLVGIHTTEQAQIVFVDTPGIHQDSHKAINRQMNRTAWQSMDFVDIIVQVSEAGHWSDEDQRIADGIKPFPQPTLHLLNKIDRFKDKTQLLSALEAVATKADWQAIIPISAQNRQNLDAVEQNLIQLLPQQAWLFPADQITTAGMRFIAAETIREKLFRYLHQELPYQLGVIIERYATLNNIVHIDATIIVERASQKGIVIGQKGKTLKLVGQRARADLEKTLEQKVMLRTWVKVKENWRDDDQLIKSMGYDDGR